MPTFLYAVKGNFITNGKKKKRLETMDALLLINTENRQSIREIWTF